MSLAPGVPPKRKGSPSPDRLSLTPGVPAKGKIHTLPTWCSRLLGSLSSQPFNRRQPTASSLSAKQPASQPAAIQVCQRLNQEPPNFQSQAPALRNLWKPKVSIQFCHVSLIACSICSTCLGHPKRHQRKSEWKQRAAKTSRSAVPAHQNDPFDCHKNSRASNVAPNVNTMVTKLRPKASKVFPK